MPRNCFTVAGSSPRVRCACSPSGEPVPSLVRSGASHLSEERSNASGLVPRFTIRNNFTIKKYSVPTSGGAPRARPRCAYMFASLSPPESHSRLRAGKRTDWTSDLIHDTNTQHRAKGEEGTTRARGATNRAKDEQGKSRDTARNVHRGPSTRLACRNARAWQRH